MAKRCHKTVLPLILSFLLTAAAVSAQTGQLLAPSYGVIGVETPVAFDWTDAGASVWQIELSQEISFGSIELSQLLYTSEFNTDALPHNTVLFWRVRYGSDTGGENTWWYYTAPSVFRTALEGCCVGDRGNINADAEQSIDIADLVYLVNYMFNQGPALPCQDEADISPLSNPDGSVDIADLVALVTYMFSGGAAPGPCPHWIEIVGLQEGDNIVSGTASVLDNDLNWVVLWAKTDRWYIQPTTLDPLTPIQTNGAWSNFTNPWARMVALLVDSSYVPGSILPYHPSNDPGVLDWDEYPERLPDRFIDWSGYRWRVKNAEMTSPGPNPFSDDTANVRIDDLGRLHLKIDYRDGKWYCAEIILDHTLGYGLYRFKLDSRVDSLDYNTILGGFLYETTGEEFDFEFSQRLAAPYNSQYVVQPWYNPGNIDFYDLPPEVQTTHAVEWRSDHIVFTSWTGHADAATPGTLIHTWTYTGSDIPVPGDERMIFNLYLYGGDPPALGVGDEVIVDSFDFFE